MTGIRRPGLESRASAAWLAAVATVLLAVLVLGVAPFVTGSLPEMPVLAGIWVPTAGVALLLADRLGWDDLRREWLLLIPVLLGAALELTGRFAPHIGVAYTPIFVMVFVFVGLTQRRFLSPVVVPPAVIAWLDLLHHRVDSQTIVRVVVVSLTWVLTAEVLSWRTADQARIRAELAVFADRDPLTGLANRRLLAHRFTGPSERSALIMVDLDHFKQLNDTHGHAEGDRVLADFAHVVVAVLRQGDTAYRYGGEEFVLVAPQTGLAGAQRLLGRVRAAWQVARPEVTFSAGVAVWTDGEDAEDVLARADAALYRAKADGRDCWRVSDPPLVDRRSVVVA